MPYNSNSTLPPAVRNSLPAAAQTVFRNVVNNRLAAGQDDQPAFRQGWAAVHRDWQKPKDGSKWVRKGYPEFEEGQARGADGQWTSGGGSSSASKPAGEGGLHRAGRYTLTTGALLAAAALGVVAAPVALRLGRVLGGHVARAARAPRAAPTPRGRSRASDRLPRGTRLEEATAAASLSHSFMVTAQIKAASTRASYVARLARGGHTKAQRRHLERQIKNYTDIERKFATHARQLKRKMQTLSARVAAQSKKRAVYKRTAPVFVCRYLVNTDEFTAWAKSQGFPTAIDPKDQHVTIAYSRQPMEWPSPQGKRLVIRPSEDRSIEQFDKGAVVLRFNSKLLTNRWKELREAGASWDYGDQYKPHVTITYKVPESFDLSAVEPYKGPLIFGPEHVRPKQSNIEHVEKLRERLNGSAATFSKAHGLYLEETRVTKYDCQLLKAENKKLGLIFGWAIISSENGQPYYDTQGDHIPDDSMLRAAAEFMESKRTMKIMHGGKKVGTVVFAWPMTQEIAQAMGVKGNRTGLMIAVKPDNPNVIERFRTNQYTGFSIGGNRLIDKDVDEEGTSARKAVGFGVLKAGWEESKHPRDQRGRWANSAGSFAAVAGLAAAGLAGAAGLGVRGARHLLPMIRRAVLAARTRGTRRALGRAAATGDFGSSRSNFRATMGAFTAAGHENQVANAMRAARRMQSPAARRRAVNRAWARGVHRPTLS